MKTEHTRRIWNEIERSVQGTDAWLGYVQAMQLLLEHDRRRYAGLIQDPLRWALLPGLCCQAAGGDLHWADQIAAAWYLFYFAAHLMDSVVDQDNVDALWASLNPSAAVNAASGLYFSASKTLNRIFQHPQSRHAAEEVTEDFYNSFLVMSGGQHLELVVEKPDLDQYWQIAEAKSGAFFALACRSGARLASSDQALIAYFGNFGVELGVLLQMKDDLEDYSKLECGEVMPNLSQFYHSLPFVYASCVLPDHQSQQLDGLIRSLYHDRSQTQDVFELIEASGFVLFFAAEIEKRQHRAQAFLERTKAAPSFTAPLLGIIHELSSL